MIDTACDDHDDVLKFEGAIFNFARSFECLADSL